MTRIALTTRLAPDPDHGEPRDALAHEWVGYLTAIAPDVVPVLVPNTLDDPVGFCQQLGVTAIVLTGGADPADTVRDRTELRLLDHARRSGLPLLGVCRGMQVVQRHLGGALVRVGDDSHVAATPTVVFQGPWADHAPRTVPCYHRLAVAPDGLAPGLVATARDDHGRVEAAVDDARTTLVMWHPERRRERAAAEETLVRGALGIEEGS